MKKLFIALLFVSTQLHAQQLSVENKPVLNEDGKMVDAWVAHLDQDQSYCMNTYSEFMRKNFDYRTGRRAKNILSVDKKTFGEISSLRIDQRAIFWPESNGTAVAFQFSPGYDIHFGNELYKDEFNKAETLVKNYVRFHYKYFYDEKIKDLNSKIKSKQKSISNNEARISKNEKTIAQNNEDISANAEGAEKLRDKNSKLEKENDSMHSENDKLKSEISGLEDEVSKATESLKTAEAFN
ncbi:MAG: hypothetical protein JSS90_00920 [Bacteroidetes bacterium]|jgi:cell division protein FtsB|nr:hypothetical protein [Bacteroidota bacterium]